MKKIVIPIPKISDPLLSDRILEEEKEIITESNNIIHNVITSNIKEQNEKNNIISVISRGEIKDINGFKIKIWPKIEENWTIEDIVIKCSPPGWLDVFEQALPDLRHISNILETEEKTLGPWYPLKRNLFRAFNLTPLSKVKVVIIGQDPYPQLNSFNGQPRAQGLSFSVDKNDAIPASLRVIYDEIADNYPDEFARPNHGNLEKIALQGVLFLNKCLTIRPGRPKSHGSIWNTFISKVFTAISIANPQCIVVMWGNDAKECGKMIGPKCKPLFANHPSPSNRKGGFRGCGHFRKINELLEEQGKSFINWNS